MLSVTVLLALGPAAAGEDTSGQQAAQAGAAMGVDLYHSLAPTAGNLVFSPYSIADTVALLTTGATGRTKDELLRALHWNQGPDGIAGAFGAQDLQLAHSTQSGSTLLTANGLWYQRGDTPGQAFLETAKTAFGAEVRGADFIENAPAAEHEINAWVGLKTLGKIPDPLPSGSLNAATRLALVNAVYFKGQWEHPFKEGSTEPRPFLTKPGVSVMAPLMSERGNFLVTSNADCDLLDLPYRGGGLSMVILLPKERDGLAAFEQHLSTSNLVAWLAALDFSKQIHLHVTLPRFKMTYAVGLINPLKELGVLAAFDPNAADFSAIDGKHDLSVSTVLHKAFIDVNEEGTEAAATTFVGMAALGIERSDEFNADHPFLFLIRDKVSGSLLFLGRVENPLAH